MHPSPLHLRAALGPLLLAGVTAALVFAAGLVSGHTLFAHPSTAAPSSRAAGAAPPPTSAGPLLVAAGPIATADSCGLPAGITIDALTPAGRSSCLNERLFCPVWG